MAKEKPLAKPISILTKFKISGDRPTKDYCIIDKTTLFDFNENNYYSLLSAPTYDDALNLSEVNFYKSIGLLSCKHSIGIRKVKSSVPIKSDLSEKYQTFVTSKKPVRYINDFLSIRSPHFIQASKFLNQAHWYKNRQDFYLFFDNAYKMVEVISNYFLNDIENKTEQFLKKNQILYLKKTMIRQIKTMHPSALKVLKKNLKLDDEIIQKLEIARKIRNEHSAHGVVDIHSYMLTVVDYEAMLGHQGAISGNMKSKASLINHIINFDNRIFDKIFFKFAQFIKKARY